MSRALAPIPQAVPGQLRTITSLPPWLNSLVAAVSDLGSSRVTMVGGVPTKRVPTLPAHMMPTDEQRSLISARITELRRLFPTTPGPRADLVETIGIVLHAFAAQSLGAQSARAKVATYLLALEDMPAWAVQEAYRRWSLGQAGAEVPADEYSFAPSTVRLRRLAQFCMDVAEGQCRRLGRVLEAEPEHLVSDEQAAENAARLDALRQDVQTAAQAQPRQPGGRTPAESMAAGEIERAKWQRWCERNPPQEEASNA